MGRGYRRRWCSQGLRQTLEQTFESAATLIATHAWKVAISCFLLNVLFGFGLLTLELNNNIEDIYFPLVTETETNIDKLSELFPDRSDTDFYEHTSVKQPMYGEVIIRTTDFENVFNKTVMKDIERLIRIVYTNVSVKSGFEGELYYKDVCARRHGDCVISGMEFVNGFKENADIADLVKPLDTANKPIYDPRSFLGDYTVLNGTVLNAKYLKLRFHLRQETDGKQKYSRLWEYRFTEKMKRFHSNVIKIVFRHAGSFYEELGWDTYPDIPYFSLAFTVLLTYCGFLISGGDCVTKRVHIGRAGILVTPLAVLGGWGFLSGVGMPFTDTIGMMPFLVMCNELHNIMVALSALNDVGDEPDATKRVAFAMRSSGVPVTITTLCHIVTFMIGFWSGYKVVRIVSAYTVITFVYNYVNHILFFTACLAIHERRIDSLRHCCTCKKLESREKLRESGATFCTICCCSGRRATSREQIESPMEKLARILLSRYILTPVMKAFAVILCICYIAATIFGISNLQVDSIQTREVKDISYFSHFETVDLNHFPREYTVSFTILKPLNYQHFSSDIKEYINKVKQLDIIENQTYFWYDSYIHTSSNRANTSSLAQHLRASFLPSHHILANDVLISSDNASVLASRFYMKTTNAPTTKQMIVLKKKLKKIYLLPGDFDESAYKHEHDKDDDDFDDDDYEDMFEDNNIILANSPDFIHTDSYRLPLKEIIRIAAGYLATSCFFTLLFVPHPFLPFHMAVMFISFLLGLIGISFYVGIYMTPVPMIVTMFGCGYGIEVIIHSYFVYMTSKGTDRGSRTNTILSTVSPILFHTNFASFLGLLVLLVVESYVFQTVFRVLEIALALCVLYAVFFIPVSLAFTGPGSIFLPGSSKVVKRDSKASKNALDQVGTQMSNGIEPISNGHIKNGSVVHNGGTDNLGFEKV